MNWDNQIDEQYENDQAQIDHAVVNYQQNKAASVGESCICPMCTVVFRKKSYQQAFHSTKCKDRYWNLTVPERQHRAKLYS